MLKTKPILGALIGYAAGYITNGFMPLLVTLLFPLIGLGVGVLLHKQPKPENKTISPNNSTEEARKPLENSSTRSSSKSIEAPPSDLNPIFQPVVEYVEVLEDMIISEGQKNNLDSEIVEKCCSLFVRLQRVIPLLSELNNDEINHTVKRLVIKELNSVINPFLRLSGEAKTKNRRILLTGLKDVNTRISEIVATIEHKDLLELQTKAEVIHKRYANS
jgi:hypothetical protein